MHILTVILALIISVYAMPSRNILEEEWHAFKLEHCKEYQDQTEDRFRFEIFLENKLKIVQHNQLFSMGKVSYKQDVNKYADMLQHEFSESMNGYNPKLRKFVNVTYPRQGVAFISAAHVEIPSTLDWRNEGAVTGVKDQGRCGSCWAFSSTGSLEGQHYRKTGVLVALSEQNLVDCSINYGNTGCSGGLMNNAFRYIRDNGGIDTEKSYPYKGVDDSCHYNPNTVGAIDSGYVNLPTADEEKLKQAVATIGPISVAIDASHTSFQFYSSGVYNEPNCKNQLWSLSHAVLVVGYGTTSNGENYWLVKNSWGTNWGDKGYIKMARNTNNQCGIATVASYPLV